MEEGKTKTKVCEVNKAGNGCGKEYPLTEEFWTRDRHTSDGWNRLCKICKQSMARKGYRDRVEIREKLGLPAENARKVRVEDIPQSPELPKVQSHPLKAVIIDINRVPGLWELLQADADKDLRSPDLQVLHIIKNHLEVKAIRSQGNDQG